MASFHEQYYAFYEHLEQNPDDFVTRLVLADFLAEHSEECQGVANAIRWQVAMKHVPYYAPAGAGHADDLVFWLWFDASRIYGNNHPASDLEPAVFNCLRSQWSYGYDPQRGYKTLLLAERDLYTAFQFALKHGKLFLGRPS